jgi:hypothetical protein
VSKVLKAVLLSALVFPGSGHFLLKSHVKGALLAGVSIVCLYFLMSVSVEMAQEISVKIQAGDIPLDVAKITQALLEQSSSGTAQQANISSLLLVICWLIGIIDSYRVGRSKKRGARVDGQKA